MSVLKMRRMSLFSRQAITRKVAMTVQIELNEPGAERLSRFKRPVLNVPGTLVFGVLQKSRAAELENVQISQHEHYCDFI